MGTRRMFTREFKLEAVKLVSERGVKVAHASALISASSRAPIAPENVTTSASSTASTTVTDTNGAGVIAASSRPEKRKVRTSPIAASRPIDARVHTMLRGTSARENFEVEKRAMVTSK